MSRNSITPHRGCTVPIAKENVENDNITGVEVCRHRHNFKGMQIDEVPTLKRSLAPPEGLSKYVHLKWIC